MRKWLAIACLGSLALSGCGPQAPAGKDSDHTLASRETTTPDAGLPKPPAPTGGNDIIAIVRGRAITRDQLQDPLMKAFGLRFLLHMAKLELAIETAREAGLTATDEEVAREREMTVDAWFKEYVPAEQLKGTEAEKADFRKKEYEKILVQYLERTHVTMPEFEIAVRTSAYVRKIVESQIRDTITDEHLRTAFAIEYGEKVKVRHIQLKSMEEVNEVQRLLNGGVSFEDLARKYSLDTDSAKVGGEIRAFSREETGVWPQVFIEAAFALQNPGEISQPIKTGESFHLLKLVERIPPRVVRFEDHRQYLYKKLYDALLTVSMRQLHTQLSSEATREIRIQDPMLQKQLRDQLDRALGDTHDSRDMVRKEMESEKLRGAAPQPSNSADIPTTQPGRGEVARPPATMPGR